MDLKLFFLILLLVSTVSSCDNPDNCDEGKLRSWIKGAIKLVRKIAKATATFTTKVVVSKSGEKIAMNVVEKVIVKGAKHVPRKILINVGKKAGIFAKKVPVVGLVAGIGFGAWRIIEDPTDWKSYAFAIAEVGSGAVSMVPGIGTYASVGMDGLILYYD